MKNYYRDAIYYIIDSKISTDRKLKLIFNLNFLLEDERKKGRFRYIDEQGFEQIKEKIIKEENELENSESSELITNEEVFQLKTIFEMVVLVDRYAFNLNYLNLYKKLCNEINYKNEYMEELYEEMLEWKKQADEYYKKKAL